MVKIRLGPIKCPSCDPLKTFSIEVEESLIKEAKRYPTAVSARCPSGHILVLFVDATFCIRDVQLAAKSKDKESGALDKMSDWIGGL